MMTGASQRGRRRRSRIGTCTSGPWSIPSKSFAAPAELAALPTKAKGLSPSVACSTTGASPGGFAFAAVPAPAATGGEMFPACFLTPEAALACRTVPQRLQRIVWAAQFAGMRSSCLQPGHRALSTSGMARSLTRMRKRRYLLSCCHLNLKQTEVQNLREGFRSVLFEARALRIGAEFQRDGIAVGALAPGGLHAPEVRHPCLV